MSTLHYPSHLLILSITSFYYTLMSLSNLLHPPLSPALYLLYPKIITHILITLLIIIITRLSSSRNPPSYYYITIHTHLSHPYSISLYHILLAYNPIILSIILSSSNTPYSINPYLIQETLPPLYLLLLLHSNYYYYHLITLMFIYYLILLKISFYFNNTH